jgi:Fe-S-cluster formation regulator IscX/YfhJ
MLTSIGIEITLNGWIIHAGCQKVVFTDKHQMLVEIDRFLADPEASEKYYRTASLNAHLLLEGSSVEPGDQCEASQPPLSTASRDF